MSRRFRRRPTRALLAAAVLAALLAGRYFTSGRSATPEALVEGEYRVERVVDGDTLLLANRARVRLQGIDTPETVKPDHEVEAWGPEAAQFTRDFVSGGSVRLRFDRERIDRFGRFLAYVYVDGRMLNEELLRAGLATAETGYRYSQSMKRKFLAAEAEAKNARRGIWSARESDRADMH